MGEGWDELCARKLSEYRVALEQTYERGDVRGWGKEKKTGERRAGQGVFKKQGTWLIAERGHGCNGKEKTGRQEKSH